MVQADVIATRTESALTPPTIEKRAQLLQPGEFPEHIIWRRQRFAKLRNGEAKPKDPAERSRLEVEIKILSQRARVLQSDKESPNLGDVEQRLADITRQMAQASTKDSFLQKGLAIRKQLLLERQEALRKAPPEIHTMDRKKWKTIERHNGEALPLDKWEQLSPRLKANPDANVNEQQEFRWYMQSLSPEHRGEVNALSAQMKPIDDRVEAVVCMPAYQEGKNIYRTLSNFTNLKDRSGSAFDNRMLRVVVFENYPISGTPDSTAPEIARFKREHPEVQIDHIRAAIDPKVRAIGNIRNIATAAIIENASRSRLHATHDLIYISNDADTPEHGVKPTYIADILYEFDTHPRMDALSGKIDFPEDLMAKVPLHFATRRLWQYMDTIQAHKRNKEPFLVGRNSSMRLKMIAAVGNYDPTDAAGEDVEIGNKIKSVRSWDTLKHGYDRSRRKQSVDDPNNRVRYVHRISMEADPRRDFVRIVSGQTINDQYVAFEKDQAVRGKSGAELAQVALAKGYGEFNLKQFEREAAAFYYDAKSWEQWGGIKTFDRALGLLGAKYEIVNGKFTITDVTNLEKNFYAQQFREIHQKPVERWLIKLNIGEFTRVDVLRSGKNNQVFSVDTRDGKKLIIRMSNKADNRFEEEKWVIDLARKNGIPAPHILAIDSSKTIAPGWNISVSERLQGKAALDLARDGTKVSDTLIFQSGQLLRKIHDISLKQGYGYIDTKKGEGQFPEWDNFMLSPFEQAQSDILVKNNILSKDQVQRVQKIVDDNRYLMQNAPHRLLHGDFSLGNTLTDGAKVTGLLDFENAVVGDPLWDLAYFSVNDSKNMSPTGMQTLLKGYGNPNLLNDPVTHKRFLLYKLNTIFAGLEWNAAQTGNQESISMLKIQMNNTLSEFAKSYTTPHVEAAEANLPFQKISLEEKDGLLKTRFTDAVDWFKNFYEKGQVLKDQEYATGRKRYEELQPVFLSALTTNGEPAKTRLFQVLRQDKNVSLSDNELRRQIDRLAVMYSKYPELFNQVDLKNPAYRFIVYASNRGNIERYERSYSHLDNRANFDTIVAKVAERKRKEGKTMSILDEGGTFDLCIQELTERLKTQSPGLQVELASTAADDMATRFRDCHRYPVDHRMADVHHLNETFGNKKRALIVSQAAYKFFWDPLGAITQTANALEKDGWAFLGDLQENVSYNFDTLFYDDAGNHVDPVQFFEGLNSMNLGYTFAASMNIDTSMGDTRRVVTVAIHKNTDKDIAMPAWYGTREKAPDESTWISPLVYIIPARSTSLDSQGYTRVH